MFAPIGKQKILLQIKRAKDVGVDLNVEKLSNELTRKPTPVNESFDETLLKVQNSVILSSVQIERILSDSSLKGVVMRKLMKSTIRYRPGRDTAILQAFQSKFIPYEVFEIQLQLHFGITFSEKELSAFYKIFDPMDTKHINGLDFLVTLKRLISIRIEKDSEIIREKNEAISEQLKTESEKQQLNLSKKLELQLNFEVSEDTRNRARSLLIEAAKLYDPQKPNDLNVFRTLYLKPAVFRELLKNTLGLRLGVGELSSLVKDMNLYKTDTDQILSDSFLQQFLKLSFDLRTREVAGVRRKQRVFESEPDKAEETCKENLAKRDAAMVDFQFDEADEARAEEKFEDAAERYVPGHPSSPPLSAFECESLDPAHFRDLAHKILHLQLTARETGYFIRKYDSMKTQRLLCAPFISAFLRAGHECRAETRKDMQSRSSKKHKEQHINPIIERIRPNLFARPEDPKTAASLFSDALSCGLIDNTFDQIDMQSALSKTNTAILEGDLSSLSRSDLRTRLSEFEHVMSVQEFRHLLSSLLPSLTLNPKELAALISQFDKSGKGLIDGNMFSKKVLAIRDRSRPKSELRSRPQTQTQSLPHSTQPTYSLEEVDFCYTETDKDNAFEKLQISAGKYDKRSPTALSLGGFESSSLSPLDFRNLCRSVLDVKLKPKEVGAVVRHFDQARNNTMDGFEFINRFLEMSYQQRHKIHLEFVAKRRDHLAQSQSLSALSRPTTSQLTTSLSTAIDTNFSEEDQQSAMEKIGNAARDFERHHPAAPSLACFESSSLPPSQFKDILRTTFGLLFSPKELGYLVYLYDTAHSGTIDADYFLRSFLAMGIRLRQERKKKDLEEQRARDKAERTLALKKEQESSEKSDWRVDFDFSDSDYLSAVTRLTEVSSRFSSSHPSSPSLATFESGCLRPAEFRGVILRIFHLNLSPKEVGAIAKQFAPFEEDSDDPLIDGPVFIQKFLKLGKEKKNQSRSLFLEQQRRLALEADQEKSRRNRLDAQRFLVEIDEDFRSSDLSSALEKIRGISAGYDKNMPGSLPLTALEAKYLSPHDFRELLRKSFSLVLTPKELAAIVTEFRFGDEGDYLNLDCKKFVSEFTRMGVEERSRKKQLELEKQRKFEHESRVELEKKEKEKHSKNSLVITYDYSKEERVVAFAKLTEVARRYDKNSSGSVDLDQCVPARLDASALRELLKNSFQLLLTNQELGAIMHFFDKEKTGVVPGKAFVTHFRRIGAAEKIKSQIKHVIQSRRAVEAREREDADRSAFLKSKFENTQLVSFTPEEQRSGREKLALAAFNYDPTCPGPMGVRAFSGASMTPMVFREMLKRSFDVKLTDGELSAVVLDFDKDSNGLIDAPEFLVKFTTLGFDQRNALREKHLKRNKERTMKEKEDRQAKEKAFWDRINSTVDYDFSKEDFQSALQKTRQIAANYDSKHPSCPSLQGFTGASLTPPEFRDMLMRTFKVYYSPKEMGSLVKFFDNDRDGTVDTCEFLSHFFKIQHSEQFAKRSALISEGMEQKKKNSEQERNEERRRAQIAADQLKYSPQDEASFLSKVRDAAQQFASCSSTYSESMQNLKAPSLYPQAFRNLFYNIFMVKFTVPEVGVLLSVLGSGHKGIVEGPSFLKWFHKLARQEEKFLLGQIGEECFTMSSLRGDSQTFQHLQPFNRPPSSLSPLTRTESLSQKLTSSSPTPLKRSASSPTPPISGSSTGKSKSTEILASSQTQSQAHVPKDPLGFSQSTLDQSWVLPSLSSVDEPRPDLPPPSRADLFSIMHSDFPVPLSPINTTPSTSSLSKSRVPTSQNKRVPNSPSLPSSFVFPSQESWSQTTSTSTSTPSIDLLEQLLKDNVPTRPSTTKPLSLSQPLPTPLNLSPTKFEVQAPETLRTRHLAPFHGQQRVYGMYMSDKQLTSKSSQMSGVVSRLMQPSIPPQKNPPNKIKKKMPSLSSSSPSSEAFYFPALGSPLPLPSTLSQQSVDGLSLEKFFEE